MLYIFFSEKGNGKWGPRKWLTSTHFFDQTYLSQ